MAYFTLIFPNLLFTRAVARLGGLLCLLIALAWAQPARVYVDSITLIGLEKTHSQVVLREIAIHQNDSIQFEDLGFLLLKSKQNIYNLGLFTKVDFAYKIDDKNVHIEFVMRERWYIFPIPYAASEERTTYDFINSLRARQWPRVVFGGSLQWRNVLGNNETLSLFAQTGFSQRFNVDFTRPALLPHQNIDFAVGANLSLKKSTICATTNAQAVWARMDAAPVQVYWGCYLQLRKRFSPRTNAYLRLQYRHFRVSDSIRAFAGGDRYLPDYQHQIAYPALNVGYESDHRDVRFFPLSGYRLHVVGRYAGLRNGSAGFGKLGLAWSHHIPLSKRWFSAYGIQSFYTIGNNIPFIEKYFLGLQTNEIKGFNEEFRGYEPYLIAGTNLHTAKAELKYALIPRQIVHIKQIPFRKFQDWPIGAYLSAFCDAGYVRDRSLTNQDTALRNELLLGYGLGLNVIGPYDLLGRLEYSRNRLGQSGFYVHFTVSVP